MAHFRNKINPLASSRAIFAAILPHSFSRMVSKPSKTFKTKISCAQLLNALQS